MKMNSTQHQNILIFKDSDYIIWFVHHALRFTFHSKFASLFPWKLIIPFEDFQQNYN